MSDKSGKLSVQMTSRGINPRNIDEAFRVSTALAKSGICPRNLNTPEKIMVVGMAGAEIGLSFVQSVMSMYVVNGKPSLEATPALGLVRGSGRMKKFTVDEIVENGDVVGFEVYSERKDQEDAEGIRSRFTMKMARAAGLTGKEVWKKYPERMLRHRATSINLRDNFSDVLLGIGVVGEDEFRTVDSKVVGSVVFDQEEYEEADPIMDMIDNKVETINEMIVKEKNKIEKNKKKTEKVVDVEPEPEPEQDAPLPIEEDEDEDTPEETNEEPEEESLDDLMKALGLLCRKKQIKASKLKRIINQKILSDGEVITNVAEIPEVLSDVDIKNTIAIIEAAK